MAEKGPEREQAAMTETTGPFGPCPPRPELDRLLRDAVQHKMTPAEIREQKISWVFGQLPHDDPRTKDDVRASLEKQGLL